MDRMGLEFKRGLNGKFSNFSNDHDLYPLRLKPRLDVRGARGPQALLSMEKSQGRTRSLGRDALEQRSIQQEQHSVNQEQMRKASEV